MNTFGGVAAFNPGAEVSNHRNGVLITSDGGGKYFDDSTFSTIILTCQFSGNDRNGIEISGNAAGVQVSQSVIGLETDGASPQPNRQNGIEIGGNTSGIAIGGFEPSRPRKIRSFPKAEASSPCSRRRVPVSGDLRDGVAVEQDYRRVT